jgi:glucosamine 6-phosphate synthetase-like amidotransferase/phosphosugar isomerase protein
MKRWMVIALAIGMVALFANAQESISQKHMSGMDTKDNNMGMQGQKMKQNCMMGMMGMMDNGGMMADPEMKQMMKNHRKHMMQEQMKFKNMMQKKMMSKPTVIKKMLTNMLNNPETVKKVLNDNPDLKAKLKKVL